MKPMQPLLAAVLKGEDLHDSSLVYSALDIYAKRLHPQQPVELVYIGRVSSFPEHQIDNLDVFIIVYDGVCPTALKLIEQIGQRGKVVEILEYQNTSEWEEIKKSLPPQPRRTL